VATPRCRRPALAADPPDPRRADDRGARRRRSTRCARCSRAPRWSAPGSSTRRSASTSVWGRTGSPRSDSALRARSRPFTWPALCRRLDEFRRGDRQVAVEGRSSARRSSASRPAFNALISQRIGALAVVAPTRCWAVSSTCTSRVLGAERAVTRQRLLARDRAGERPAQLATERKREVEGRPDALRRQRQAVPGRVADEEHAVLGRRAQLVGDPVALVADRFEPEVAWLARRCRP
jgi:hypothetical protein